MVQFFFSGVEGKHHHTDVYELGGRRVLASYYYLRERAGWLEERLKKFPGSEFMIDSGAHTFHASGSGSRKELRDYVREYADWIWEHTDKAKYFVELDIPEMKDEMEGWREELFRPLELAGVPIIYVWHPEQKQLGDSFVQVGSDEEWQRMISRYGFVGLSFDIEDPGRYITMARSWLTPVHGFAMSAAPKFEKFDFTTVDSTSWKGGEMYGDAYVFVGGKMIRYKGKAERMKYRSHYESIGRDIQKLVQDTDREVTKANVQAFLAMEQAVSARRATTEYGVFRVPPPAAIEGMSKNRLKQYRAPIWPADEEPDGFDIRLDLLTTSIFQWGLWDELDKRLRKSSFAENLQEAWEIDPDVAGDRKALENLRLDLNARLLQSRLREPLARGAEDFEDVFEILPREEELAVEPDDQEYFE